MKTINMHEAKTHLSRLVEEAVAGEEIIIAKNGKPFVSLTPYQPKNTIKFGIWENEPFTIPEDFDKPDQELIQLMTDGPLFPHEQ